MAYLTRVRLERPAIGTFNGRDIAVLFIFIVGLPLLYLILPLLPLLIFLGITFASALSMGLRPILGPSVTWLAVGTLIGFNIYLTRTMLGTVLGWQIWWLVNSLMIILAAVTVANLYVQGGMRVRHIAWFALVLAVYDAIFTFVWPVTNQLAQRFIGWPLDPAIGFRIGVFNYSLGLGDLLVYAMFVIGVHKAYGNTATQDRTARGGGLRRGHARGCAALQPHLHRCPDRSRRPRAGGLRTRGLPVLPVAEGALRPGTHHGRIPGGVRCGERKPTRAAARHASTVPSDSRGRRASVGQ